MSNLVFGFSLVCSETVFWLLSSVFCKHCLASLLQALFEFISFYKVFFLFRSPFCFLLQGDSHLTVLCVILSFGSMNIVSSSSHWTQATVLLVMSPVEAF